MSVVANVAINVDSSGATQQLRAVQQGAAATGQAVDKLNATTAATSDKFKIAANGIKYFTDATGRARAENGRFLSSSERAAAGLKAQGDAAQKASGKFNGLRNAIAGLGAGLALRKSFVDASELESAQARIGLLVKNFGQLSGIQNLAADAAKKFNLSQSESLNALTDLGNRIGPTGASLKDISTVYDGFNTLLVLNKVNSQQAASATLQLNQALGSGRLAGEEFNAISEATPQLLDAVAVVMGKNRSELKKLAADGQISSAVLIKALKKIKDEGAKDLETAFGGAFGATRKFDAAIADFSATVGTELLPVLTPLINKVTEILKQFGSLPGPVKTAAAAILGGTAAFVVLAPAISAAIGLLGGLKLAAIGAIGSIGTLSGALLALAGIGIVTVGVNYVVTQVGDIIGSSTAAGKSVAAASKGGLQAQLKGKSAEDRKKMLAASQKNLANDKKLASELSMQITAQERTMTSAGEGPLPSERSKLTEIQARINTNQTRIKAIQTLPITPATPPKPQLPPPSGAIPPPSGGGGGAEPKEKKIKVAKEILDISKEEATLRGQLALYTAQEDLYTQALLTKELAIFKAKQDQLGPNERKLQMFEAEITYVKTINDLEKEKTDKLKSQNELNQQRMQPLQDELALMQARLAGNEAEVMLKIQIRDIMAGTTGLAEKDVADTLNQIDATKRLLTEKEKIANLVQNIGASIEGGIVGAIDGAITGAKSLQESLTDVLKDIGKMLISFGVKSLLGGIDIGGTKIFGGGKAAGGPVSSNSTYMVGEKGPELFVPNSSGTIIPADATAAMARYQRQGGGSDNELDPVAAMARYQRQDGSFAGMGSNRNTTNNANSTTNNGYNTNGSNTTNNGYNTAGNNTTNNGYNTAGNNTTNNGYDTNGDTVNNIQTSPSPVLAFSFETTRFLGQDYVSTDQLQAAMMATEKRATAAGAKAGAAQVTSKLQQSPAYRRQVGLR
jgi:tape measure domain-containing protein